jgi:hypothetical protein
MIFHWIELPTKLLQDDFGSKPTDFQGAADRIQAGDRPGEP